MIMHAENQQDPPAFQKSFNECFKETLRVQVIFSNNETIAN